MKKLTQLFFTAMTVSSCCLYLLTGCGAQADRSESQSLNKTDAIADNAITRNKQLYNAMSSDETVKSIELPHDEADFPPGEGRELFISRCNVCHSLRYITMQPDFPEATWAKEVDKMIKTFGAHITEPEAKQIIEYLTTIKSKPAQKH